MIRTNYMCRTEECLTIELIIQHNKIKRNTTLHSWTCNTQLPNVSCLSKSITLTPP